jgi:dTMP kinase
MFITFEGGEGTGKSTQVQLLAKHLTTRSITPITTREPGGTASGEALRTLLVSGDVASWTATSEALLNYAARQEHLEKLIRPALAEGKLVICDRFMDSTRAYQQYAGGCDPGLIDILEKTVVSATRPGMTFIFDLDPSVGLARARLRGSTAEDRFERKGVIFHARLRAGFLDIALSDPNRCRVIDANLPIDTIAELIATEVDQKLHGS